MAERPYGIAALDRPRRLPRAGRIRLGEKEINQQGKEYPKELDHFNLVDAPAVKKMYGDNCRELDIIFPVNDQRTILDLGYMAYGATGWKCRGNGETAYNRELDDEIDCAGEDCKMVAESKCRRQGRLTFICYLVPGLCVYDIVTSSWRSIENCMALIETLQDLFGRIDGIPLKLYREPYQMSYTDDSGKQHNQTHHCIRLDVAASLLQVKRLQLGGGNLEVDPVPLECVDDLYPQPIQQAEALPPAQEKPQPARAPHPSWEAEPVEEVEDAAIQLLEILPEVLRKEIETGFEICGMASDEQRVLLERYHRQPQKLLGYLSAKVDSINQ